MANDGFSYWKRLTGAECAILLLLVAIMAGAALFGGHAAAVASDRARLADYSRALFARAVEIAAVTTRTLQEAAATDAPCSAADLDLLRQLAFYSQLLRDIGRLEGNRIACSAAWGLQTRRIPGLPAPDLEIKGIRLWTGLPNPANPKVVNDMAANRDTIVTTSPAAFAGFEPPAGSQIDAQVTYRDGWHVFLALGNADGLTQLPTTPWYDLGRTPYVHRCEDVYLLCVTARKRDAGLFGSHPALPLGLGLLGSLAGAGLGLAAIGYRRRREALPMRLRRMLARDELSLHYQPLRALADGRLVGAEALARWRDDDGNRIAPDVFIPMAERMGLIGVLTRRVIRKALSEMAPRLRDGDGFYLSLNVSAEDLLDAGLHAYLDEQVREFGVPPDRIVLEITERSTAGHAELAESIRGLRRHGYRFYIDDFGTGYSNLSGLASLPIDAIKMDRMFVQSIGTDSPVNAIIRPMCEIARQLDVGLVIEGIESEAQAAYIRELMPSAIGQGWLLGRPVPLREFPQR